MKKIYSIITFLFLANVLYAQTRGISYQAVILNPNQQELPGVDAEAGVLPNKAISLRFTIVNEGGDTDYQEVHYVTTDPYGMVNLFIGDGDPLSANSFAEIDWDGTPKRLVVDIDFDGGNNFVPLSNQKLTFVPFAAHKNITATGNLTVDGPATFNSSFTIEGETTFNSNMTIKGNAAIDGDTEIDRDLTVNGLTNLNSNLYVNNDSPTNLTGTLKVAGATTLNNQLQVAGITLLNSNVAVADTLNVGGITNLNNQLKVAGQANIDNSLTVTGTTSLADTLNVGGITNLNNQLKVAGQANIDNSLTVTGPTSLADTLNVGGITNLNNQLKVAGQANIDNSLTVTGTTNLTNALNVSGLTSLDNQLTVAGEVQINNSMAVSGASRIEGPLTVNNATNLNNSLTVTGDSELANLVVRGDGHAEGQHIALFENTGGGNADGIAIRIDKGTLSFRNRFVTFYGQGNYMAGRIESFDLFGGDTYESFPVPDFFTLFKVFDFSKVLTGGSLPSLTFSGGSLPSASFGRGSLPSMHWHDDGPEFHKGSLPWLSFNAGSLPTANFNTGSFPTLNFDGFFNPEAGIDAQNQIGSMVGWGLRNGYPGFIPTSHWQIALTPVILAAKQLAMNQGVIYGSKGADYAEWLEKENPEEEFVFGTVVGVKGGKISKVTEGADQVLTISMAPIVLGNMPDEDRKEAFEKVGFMGQLPVLVVGDVAVGDYIVASGNNDGYAIAVSPDEIELKDLKNIIGKAWSASNGQKVSLINVSVGLKTNEWVDIFTQQEKRLRELESKIDQLSDLSDRLNALEAKMGVN